MVKRKDPLADKSEKIKKAGEAVRKVSKKLNFDEMYDVISPEGELLVAKKSEVFFERVKEGKPFICVGTIVSVWPNGGVDVWDETNHEFFLFNHKKHYGKVKVKAFELSASAPSGPTQAHQEQQDEQRVEEPQVEPEEPESDEPMRFKLWIDDERDPPDDTWVIARSTQEAIEMVTMVGGMPHVLGLDHDLGMREDGTEDKVPDFLKWLHETSQPDDVIPDYTVHSSNPQGRENIISFMESWKKSRTL